MRNCMAENKEITATDCDIYRKAAHNNGWCEGCDHQDSNFQEIGSNTHKGESEEDKKECVACHRMMKNIVARGLCGKCYNAYRKAKTKAEEEEARLKKEEALSAPPTCSDCGEDLTGVVDHDCCGKVESLTVDQDIDTQTEEISVIEREEFFPKPAMPQMSVIIPIAQEDQLMFRTLENEAKALRRDLGSHVLHILDKYLDGKVCDE